MTVFRCIKCGAELETHGDLLRHVWRLHGADAAVITPEDLERAGGGESEIEAAIDDTVSAIQDETFERTAEAIDEVTEPNSGRIIDSRSRRTLREREYRWQATVRNRERTLGDLIDPRDEYRCAQCGRVFPHREDLDRHRWIDHGPRRAAS